MRMVVGMLHDDASNKGSSPDEWLAKMLKLKVAGVTCLWAWIRVYEGCACGFVRSCLWVGA